MWLEGLAPTISHMILHNAIRCLEYCGPSCRKLEAYPRWTPGSSNETEINVCGLILVMPIRAKKFPDMSDFSASEWVKKNLTSEEVSYRHANR